MPIISGTKFGPYEILSPLGAGGMGEVYKARDSRLDRVVAIKVLPSDFVSTPEVKERFEREARTISSLSHPHICALFDIGQQDGVEYLVLEYLEGETLADKLKKGPLSIDMLFKYAVQIADALEKAHKHGVVHRDLKPANIMVTRSGAKLMDFGLAKPDAEAAAETALEAMTVSKPLTTEGTIVGTFQYMAPEQLEGHPADARSDIFSFGCVLYEMATGQRAFKGKTQASLFAAILASEPPAISTIRPVSPPALERIVNACLQKDPEDRLQTAHDLRMQLEWAMQPGASSSSVTQAALQPGLLGSRVQRKKIMTSLLVLGWLLAALLAAWMFWRRPQAAGGAVRAEISMPTGTELTDVSSSNHIVISPDGANIAFIADSQGKQSLYVRPLNSSAFRRLEGTDGASYPFWSPDSRFIGFFADAKLKKIPAGGGVLQILCDAPAGRGGSWSSKGMILFAPNIASPIAVVPEGGGEPRQVTSIPPGFATHRLPYFLPDAKHFLFVASEASSNTEAESTLQAGELGSMETRMVMRSASNVAYQDGNLFFVKDKNLVAQTFDAGSMKLSGNPIPIAERVEYYGARYLGNFSVSQSGIVVYRNQPLEKKQLMWHDGPGKEPGKAGPQGNFSDPRISHNGQKIAVFQSDSVSGKGDVWIMDVARNTLSRLTFEPAEGYTVAWSPDDRQIATSSLSGNHGKSEIVDAGSGKAQVLRESNDFTLVASWSSDGNLLGSSQNPSTGWDVAIVNLQDKKLTPLLHTKFSETAGSFSPDGKFFSYLSDENGRLEVYVTPYPATDAKYQISSDGAGGAEGSNVVWNKSGSELYFLSTKGQMMSAAIETRNGFHSGAPRQVFSSSRVLSDFDLAPDGPSLPRKTPSLRLSI